MTAYVPDRWLIIRITAAEAVHYRVVGTWYGGFATGDSWKINSGIVEIKEIASPSGIVRELIGVSGSSYRCFETNYGCSGYVSMVLAELIEQAKPGNKIEILDEAEAKTLSTQLLDGCA